MVLLLRRQAVSQDRKKSLLSYPQRLGFPLYTDSETYERDSSCLWNFCFRKIIQTISINSSQAFNNNAVCFWAYIKNATNLIIPVLMTLVKDISQDLHPIQTWGITLAFATESSLSLLSKISISKKAYPWSHFSFNQLYFKYEKNPVPLMLSLWE